MRNVLVAILVFLLAGCKKPPQVQPQQHEKMRAMDVVPHVGGPPPVATCGIVAGSDIAGQITVLTGGPVCNVTFFGPFTNPPVCLAQSNGPTLGQVFVSATTPTGFVITPLATAMATIAGPTITLYLPVIGIPGTPQAIAVTFLPAPPFILPTVGVPPVINLVAGDAISYVCFSK